VQGSEYQKLAVVTENREFEIIRQRISVEQILCLLHGGIGLATESGEFLDGLKKHIFYGKPIDAVNLAEEMGDLFWYIAVICTALGITFEDVMEHNIAKLKARYGDKFSEHNANNRNLERERRILEEVIDEINTEAQKAALQPNEGGLRDSDIPLSR
jgi:NTP pyrophosphatase (non-canonical NTP hydrolase)